MELKARAPNRVGLNSPTIREIQSAAPGDPAADAFTSRLLFAVLGFRIHTPIALS